MAKMNMTPFTMEKLKLKGHCWLSIVALSCSFSSFADETGDAKSSNWYVGGAVGLVNSNRSAADLSKELTSSGVTVTNIAIDDSRMGWKFNVGYEVTKNLAIQAGYRDLNDVSVKLDAVVSDPEVFLTKAVKIHPNSADGFTLGSVYHYYLTNNFGLTGSVGLFNWEGDFQTKSTNGGQSLGNDGVSGTDVYFGLGGGYHLTEDVTLSIEWERYKLDKDDTQMWSIGVNYHFK